METTFFSHSNNRFSLVKSGEHNTNFSKGGCFWQKQSLFYLLRYQNKPGFLVPLKTGRKIFTNCGRFGLLAG
jgi:hypothetical protein